MERRGGIVQNMLAPALLSPPPLKEAPLCCFPFVFCFGVAPPLPSRNVGGNHIQQWDVFGYFPLSSKICGSFTVLEGKYVSGWRWNHGLSLSRLEKRLDKSTKPCIQCGSWHHHHQPDSVTRHTTTCMRIAHVLSLVDTDCMLLPVSPLIIPHPIILSMEFRTMITCNQNLFPSSQTWLNYICPNKSKNLLLLFAFVIRS